MSGRRRVAVVGGGLAGMAAALRLADRGAEVVLVERRRHLGGLTWSFRRRGLWFDNGQHVFLRCCTAYRDFLVRLGAAGQVHLQPRLEVPVLAPDGRRSDIRRSALPAPLHLAPALARYRHLSVADRLGSVRAALALQHLDPDDPGLDEVTFGSWLADHGQSPAAVERLWDLIALPTLNVRAEEGSLALAARVFRTGLFDTADGGDIGWSAVPLGRLHGENGEAALADAGVTVQLGTRVASLAPEDDRWSLVTDDGGEVVDDVVVATPPETAAELLPPGALPAVEGLGASPIVNVHLVLDRRVTDLSFAACVDSPVQFFFDRTASSGLTSGQYLAISLSGADQEIGERPEELVRRYHKALGDVLPKARRAELVDATVSREHAATFRGRPGTAALRPGPDTGVRGLYVAGAWCATGWPATMEGAVRSGLAAADACLPASDADRPAVEVAA